MDSMEWAREEIGELLASRDLVAGILRDRGMSFPPTAGDLASLPTLATGQADNLVIDTDETRVWVSRVADGLVTVETYIDGSWQVFGAYDSRYVSGDPERQRAAIGAAPAATLELILENADA